MVEVHSLSINVNNEECFGYINGNGDSLGIFVIGCESNTILNMVEFIPIKNFIDKISMMFNQKFKAIIFNIFNLTAETGFSNNIEFCEAIRQKLKQLKILHHFISDYNYIISASLIVGKIIAKLEESIYIVVAYQTNFNVFKFCFTKDGYKLVLQDFVFVDDENESVESIRQKICGPSIPDRMLLVTIDKSSKLFIRLKNNASKFKNLVAFHFDYFLSSNQVVHEMYKWLMDKKYVKYHVLPASTKTYYFSDKSVDDERRLRLVHPNVTLPFKETFPLARNSQPAYITYTDFFNSKPKLVRQFPAILKCHYRYLTLSIDAEHFPTIIMEPFIYPQIQTLPDFLDINCKSKVPVITFIDNLSFVCVPTKNKSKKYEFLDEWNGLYGRELYISFDEEKPKYCEEALEVYKTKPSFVVFDLLQIISSSPENIDRKSHWKFSFTKDAKNPVLLEFDSFDGIKKAASPQFLLAMLIKQQVKVITAKIGTKPKQMSYCFFEREKKVADKIIDAIREAFIMLKIENVLLDGFK